MKTIWWAQIKSVIRLELRKTFFARRGLWIYFLAFLPVLLFVGFSIVNSHQIRQSSRVARNGQKHLSFQDLMAIKSGMAKEEVIGHLGQPPVNLHWKESRNQGTADESTVAHEEYRYSDGLNDLYVTLADGRVDSTHIQEGYNLGRDSDHVPWRVSILLFTLGGVLRAAWESS